MMQPKQTRCTNPAQRFTPEARWRFRAETVRGVFFPWRCPFCGRVVGFMDRCDTPDCHATREEEYLQKKRLDESDYYFTNLAGAAAVYRYTGTPRDAILRLKFGRMRSAGRMLGNSMAKELYGATFSRVYGLRLPEPVLGLSAYHMIIPVPPSDASRGYNVPDLLAEPLQLALGIPLRTDILRRARFTERQATLTFAERFANVAGAFTTTPGTDLTGKQILLVDDVITTGATISACAQALIKAGAESVFAVSFATAKAEDAPKTTDEASN